MSILEIKGVNKSFGGLKALTDVNLSVEEGSIHSIIGPNGAGKSTLLNVLIAKISSDTGTVTFDGEELTDVTPHDIIQMGIARVFQTPEIFPDMTLLENVTIAAIAYRDKGFKFDILESPKKTLPAYEEA